MTYDYFLYDNRTLGPSGYDWAVKAATGLLQDDRAAKQKFVEYCEHSFDTRLGPLSNFSAALGGIRLNGGEYLLCITLETRDLHQRPSCAFVGIHCPRTTALRDLLTQGDPILSAKQTSENPGPSLVLQGDPLVTDGLLTEGDRRSGRYSFQPGSSPKNAAEILLRHMPQIQKGNKLPSILGITQWSALRSQLFSSYEFAYCVGLPAGAEAPQKPEIDRTAKKGSFHGTRAWVSFGAGAVLCVFVGFFFYHESPDSPPNTRPDPITSPSPIPVPSVSPTPLQDPTPNASPQPDTGATDTPDLFLKKFEPFYRRIESASPQNLLETHEWRALMTVPVIPNHEHEKEKMIELLKTDLPHFKDAVVIDQNLGFYFLAEQMRTLSAVQRADEIRKRASKILPPTEGCTLLRESFTLWAENSEAGKWCSLVEDFTKESR